MLQLDSEAKEWLRQHESELPSVSFYDPFLTAIRNAVKRVKPGKNSDKKIQNVLADFNQLLSASGQGSAVSNIVSDYGDFIEMYFSFVLDGEKCKDIAPRYTIYRKGQPTALSPGRCRAWIAKIEKWVNGLTSELGLSLEQKAKFLGELREEISNQKKDAAWQRLFPAEPKPGVPTRQRRTGAWWENPDYEEPAPRKDWPIWVKAVIYDALAGKPVPPPVQTETIKFLAGGSTWNQVPNVPSFRALPFISLLGPDDPEYQTVAQWARQRAGLKRLEPEPTSPPRVVPDKIVALPPKEQYVPDAADRKKAKIRAMDNALVRLLDSEGLTAEERKQLIRVMDKLKEGCTIPEISKALKLSVPTINRRIKRLKNAL